MFTKTLRKMLFYRLFPNVVNRLQNQWWKHRVVKNHRVTNKTVNRNPVKAVYITSKAKIMIKLKIK